RIHLPGAVPKETVQAYMRSADAFIQPSITEGLSLAILEAMSFGLPSLVSDIPANTFPLEFGQEAPAGYVLPLGDAAPWSEALNDIAANPQKAAELGRRARISQAEHFDQEKMYQSYLDEI